MALGFHGVDTQRSSFQCWLREYLAVIRSLQLVISDVFDNHCGFLFIDKICCANDEFFGVVTELIENITSDTC